MIRNLFRRTRELYMEYAYTRLYRKVECVSRALVKHGETTAYREFQAIIKQFDKVLKHAARRENEATH